MYAGQPLSDKRLKTWLTRVNREIIREASSLQQTGFNGDGQSQLRILRRRSACEIEWKERSANIVCTKIRCKAKDWKVQARISHAVLLRVFAGRRLI